MNARHYLLALIVLTSCKDNADLSPFAGPNAPKLPATPYTYDGLDADEVTLGRVLFYDPRLSVTNDISCGSCHNQKYSFSDSVMFSKGTLKQLATRNTIALQNSGNKLLFWDGRGDREIENVVLMPIMNEREMGVKNLDVLINELNAVPYYAPLVQKAYKNQFQQLNTAFISRALGAFVRSIQPFNSKFDQHLKFVGGMSPGVEKKTSPYLNVQELRGFSLYLVKYNCNVCHNVQQTFVTGPHPDNSFGFSSSPYSGLNTFANIGLETVAVDKGRSLTTHSSGDEGKFKIPSLRNVALTAPYMHDGRIATLSEVIDHYSKNIKTTNNLAPELAEPMTQIPKKFDISDQEKEDLIAFLKTLTDNTMVTGLKWSDPFPSRSR